MYTKVSVMVVCRICTIIMFTSEVINTLQMAWRIRSLCESTTVHIDTHTHMKPMFTLWALNHFTPSLLRNMTGAVYRDCFKAFYQVGPHLLLIKDEAAWPLPIGKCSSVQGHLGNLEFMSLLVDVEHDWIVQSLPVGHAASYYSRRCCGSQVNEWNIAGRAPKVGECGQKTSK